MGMAAENKRKKIQRSTSVNSNNRVGTVYKKDIFPVFGRGFQKIGIAFGYIITTVDPAPVVNVFSLIAEKMQMNPSTVKTRLRRGREKLRQHLTGFKTEIGGD